MSGSGDRPPAPSYRGEGPHALWHFSENRRIEAFEPHVAATASEPEALVWAVDTRHAPLFWFPRDCPRGCAWASPRTSAADLERFFAHTTATRIHVIEQAWLRQVQSARLYAYELPADTFHPHAVGGYWVSAEPVVPRSIVAVGDLLQQHADSGIELRVAPSIWPWWDAVIASTLEFSGIRLANTSVAKPAPSGTPGGLSRRSGAPAAPHLGRARASGGRQPG